MGTIRIFLLFNCQTPVSGAVAICSLPALGVAPGIQLSTILLASLFSSAVGIFFGIYPARKAAKMHPIDALRQNG